MSRPLPHASISVCVKLATPPTDRCAQVALRALAGVRPANELEVVEVGCGAGGASFELSKVAGELPLCSASTYVHKFCRTR